MSVERLSKRGREPYGRIVLTNGDRVGSRANLGEFDCGRVGEQGSGLRAPFITIRI